MFSGAVTGIPETNLRVIAPDVGGGFGMKIYCYPEGTTANTGAYLSNYATSIPTYFYATLLAGTYKTPEIYCNVRADFTTTAPVDAYRGGGRPEAAS